MGRIRTRALEGLARVFGTYGEEQSAPQDVDMAGTLLPVFDTSPGAHSRSIWLKEGWALLQVSHVHAGAGTLAAPFNIMDLLASPLFDNPVKDPSSTAAFVTDAQVVIDAAGTVANFTTAAMVSTKPNLVQNALPVIDPNAYCEVIKFCSATWPFNIPGGAAGVRLAREHTQSTQENIRRGIATRFGPRDECLFHSSVTGALTIVFNVVCWVGSDGVGPPTLGR